jgi:hypothetical protein
MTRGHQQSSNNDLRDAVRSSGVAGTDWRFRLRIFILSLLLLTTAMSSAFVHLAGNSLTEPSLYLRVYVV